MTVRKPITKHTRGFLGAETVQTGALLTGRLIHSDTNITMVSTSWKIAATNPLPAQC